jgi:hypothetical protein
VSGRVHRCSSRRGAGVALLLGLAGLVPALAAGTAGAAGPPSAGFATTVAAFEAAYPAEAVDCRVGPCYGPVVASLPAAPEFSFLTLAKGLVVGWDEALPRGTPVLQAELKAAELMPADVVMGSAFTVIHRDQFGHSCAIYDLYSKSLARRFGKHGPAGDGSDVGVELATLAPNGTTSYNPRDIDLAIVVPGWIDKTTDC